MAILYVLFMCLCALILIRNYFVFNKRSKMLDVIFKQDDYQKYLSIFDTVSYDKMVCHFWVWPIDKMFPEELQKLRG